VNNHRREAHLAVTNQGPRPGDFPLGSVESRAAARRALIEGKAEAKPVFRIVVEFMYERGQMPHEVKPPVRYEANGQIFEIVERLAW
jgi:hypothetical protein